MKENEGANEAQSVCVCVCQSEEEREVRDVACGGVKQALEGCGEDVGFYSEAGRFWAEE